MDTQPLISIIVPVYKVEKYLDNCVQSVLAQSYPNWELLLIDNASPDNCPELCDDYARKDARIKSFHVTENRGVSSGRNKGVEEAVGEYITFLDCDDTFNPDFLKEMLCLCIENDADMAQCAHIRGDNYKFPIFTQKKETGIFDNHTIFISETTNIVVWGKLYHRSISKDILFPYGKFYEDDHTTWRYYFRAKKIVVTNQPLYYYYINKDSTMVQLTNKPSLSYVEAYEERIAFFKEKNMPDLVDCSNLQLCKSFTLAYHNQLYTSEQKSFIRKRFHESWKELRGSKYIKFKYKVLFQMFDIMPQLATFLANKLH